MQKDTNYKTVFPRKTITFFLLLSTIIGWDIKIYKLQVYHCFPAVHSVYRLSRGGTAATARLRRLVETRIVRSEGIVQAGILLIFPISCFQVQGDSSTSVHTVVSIMSIPMNENQETQDRKAKEKLLYGTSAGVRGIGP